MIRLRPGLWTMESSSSWGCNTYLIEDEDRVVLVDPGPKFQLDRLARELRAAGRSPYDVTDVLLTHYDQDHSRSAAEWRRRTGATVYLGADDAQILRSHRVPGSWQRRFMMRLLGLAELPEGTVELRGKVAITPGLTALPSPGHTPGHYAFLWRDVAFIGDAANCGPDGELVPFDRALMTDPAQADATLEMLSSLPVRLFCAAHSDPVERGTSPLTKHTHSIHIDAPVREVFCFVADPVHLIAATPSAHGSLGAVTRTANGDVATYEVTHRRLGMRGTTVFTREEYVLDERIVDHSSAGVFLTCTVEPDPTGTQLTLGWHSSRPNEVLDAIFFHADAALEKSLVTFKRTIEGGPREEDAEEQRSVGERLETWTVLHPHVPALRQALALPTLAWRLGLGPALSRIGNANSHLVMLTVTGRRSGTPRHVPVAVHERRGEAYLWCPYGGRAQWYRNVVADPVVTVQSSEGTRAMRAEAIDDVDHLIELVADLREFDETFLRSYLASEGIEDTPDAIAANAHRLHVRRLAPTSQTGPPPLAADLAWAWLVPTAVIAAVVVLRTRRSKR